MLAMSVKTPLNRQPDPLPLHLKDIIIGGPYFVTVFRRQKPHGTDTPKKGHISIPLRQRTHYLDFGTNLKSTGNPWNSIVRTFRKGYLSKRPCSLPSAFCFDSHSLIANLRVFPFHHGFGSPCGGVLRATGRQPLPPNKNIKGQKSPEKGHIRPTRQ